MKQPTGLVTFLFTDIEGSTKLAQEFPDTLQASLDRHHDILSKAVETYNGFVFEIVGDAFCCAFEKADDAVNAAVEAQSGLANEKWNDAAIKVRIGIHTGNAEWNGNTYMGYITLARTARVMSAAYGGQILISNDAYILLDLPIKPEDFSIKKNESGNPETPGLRGKKYLSFRDLGERRLKDVNLPIRLYQITYPGLREDFPPVNTLDARPNNLPVQLTSFIGREKEMKNLKDDLKLNRLVTLTSAGGSGKTRLALQTAADVIDDYENGVWFTDIAAVNDPALLTATINEALCIKEESNKTTEETLADFLKEKEILLVLDNCEQIIHSCAELAERLLSFCPRLKIIATSRESLNCRGEKTYRIPPLAIPDPDKINTPEELAQYESVRLFIERALAVNPKFRVNNENASAMAEVCSRLDGIPLAIELAAARTKILTVEKIFERLDDRFRLLTGGRRTALPRQQTLRALIDWSYDLLTEKEKIFWNRLSVFTGGWTLAAAEEVCSDELADKDEILDLLSDLTEKSVIIYDESKDRYRMLESIKQYGIEKLSDGHVMFMRHLNYFAELSENTEPELRSENAKFRIGIIEADHNNFLAAIDWSLENGFIDKGAIIATELGYYWSITGNYSTGIRLAESILQRSDALTSSLKGKVLYWIGSFKWSQGNYELAGKYSGESLAIRKEIGDKYEIAYSLNNLGNIAYHQGEYEQAEKYYEESLAIRKETGDKKGIAVSLNNLGNIANVQGNYEQVKKYFEESFAIRKEIGDKTGMSTAMNKLSNLAFFTGDYEQAKKYSEEGVAMSKEIGDRKATAISLNNLGNIFDVLGNYEQAEKYCKESLAIKKEIGDKRGIAASLQNLGYISLHQEDHEQAGKYHQESLAIRKEIGDKRGAAESISNLGTINYLQGNYEQAKKYHKESLVIYKGIGDLNGVVECFNNLGNIFFDEGEYGLAVKLFAASEKIMESTVSVFDKDYQARKDETISKLLKQLSDEEFSKYRDEGKNLTTDEAVEIAINNV
ncbi:MAG TPA: tetratricopeptide repeat protein [Ignavibacteria bacterium]|nr:tetratricopeptide repeat protein [Ignavibacteria bacterium]